MSLRDILEGARQEMQDNLSVLSEKRETSSESESKSGFSRKSSAKARPSRQAGASVRTAPTRTARATETKEQRAERRRQERELDDARLKVRELLLKANPRFKKIDRIYWICLGVGVFWALLSLLFAFIFKGNNDINTWQGLVSVVTLVIAYICIVVSFLYDIIKRRPMRMELDSRVRSLSEKKLRDMISEHTRKNIEELEKAPRTK